MSMFGPDEAPSLTREQRAEIDEAANDIVPTMGSRFPLYEDFEPAAPWDTIPPGIREGLGAYFESGRPTGSFLQAVLENDLKNAILRADDLNMICIREIVRFVENHSPPFSHGSRERVVAWIDQGGLARRSSGSVIDIEC